MSAEATRDRLLEATIDAIDAGGEAAVSVDEIAKTAGVTAPTIYNHFRNRDGLIAAAQAERFDRWLAEDFDTLSSVVDGIRTREQLVEILAFLLGAFADPERTTLRMRRVSAIGSAVGRPELKAIVIEKFVELCTRMADVLSPLQERGIIRADLDLLAFSAWFTGAVTGRIFIELGDTPIDPVAWDRLLTDAVTALVLAPESD